MIHISIYDLMGFIGAFLILFGFYRTSIGRWSNKSVLYEFDNLLGAMFLVVYQLHVGAYISVILNIIWAIVALRGITSLAERYQWRGFGFKKRR